MSERPELAVTLCLDIARPSGTDEPSEAIVRRFAFDFSSRHWPWPTFPELWYDPRSLETGEAFASLHAKYVVVDRMEALVTSANFTEPPSGGTSNSASPSATGPPWGDWQTTSPASQPLPHR